jgi:hypothetical protein
MRRTRIADLNIARVRTAKLGQLDPRIGLYRTIVDVQGQGVLVGIGVADARDYHFFRIEIDGELLVQDYLCAVGSGGTRGNNGFTVWASFAEHCKVDVRDNGHISASTKYWVSYNLFR